MEFFIHKWEWTQEFVKYKDEKIFLFPLDELIGSGSIFLDDTKKVAQIGETHQMYYHGFYNNCIIYSAKDLRYSDEKRTVGDTVFEDNIYFYNPEKKDTRVIPYEGQVLISNTGTIYDYKRISEQLVIRNLLENQTYTIPAENGLHKRIINDLLVMRFDQGIVIYDLKKGFEVKKHYTENKYPFCEPEFRKIAAVQQNYQYLASEDLVVLY